MRELMRRVGTVADDYAVPVAAAVVGWIVATNYVVPHAPAMFTDSAILGGALPEGVALAAFALARRYL